MRTISLKRMIAITLVLMVFAALVSYYYLNNNSTNVPKSATLVKNEILGSDMDG